MFIISGRKGKIFSESFECPGTQGLNFLLTRIGKVFLPSPLNMKTEFLAFIHKNELVKPGEKVLLAVSGGIDSMVMLDLFRVSGFAIGVAHVNYRLRSDDSDKDQQLVQAYCTRHDIPCFVKQADPDSWKGKNVQVHARQLRYAFFDECAGAFSFDIVATAHHRDDSLETFFLNSMRGSGPDGLDGIPIQRGKIIRPLLFANRRAIQNYAEQNNLLFREDESNQKNQYNRNSIRNRILPLFDELDFRHRQGFYQTLEFVREDNQLFHVFLQNQTKEYWIYHDDYRILNIDCVRNQRLAGALLYHVLKPFGLRREQTDHILESRTIGASFPGTGWIAVLEKPGLVLYDKSVLDSKTGTEVILHAVNAEVIVNGETWSYVEYENFTDELPSPRLPLRVRPWKKNDVFRPIGMKGQSKAVKKIISESEVPLLHRPFVVVAEDKDQTIWAVLPYELSVNFGGKSYDNPRFDLLRNGQSVLFKK